ncbi:T9SS type B sorting domain-containing protein, partial [Fulvivirga sp. M361]|uniref:cadherin domain-containing protein n=1 Tax=Fulvivirga sp. M361 TaxID=2594266 RepID=UPI00117A7313
IDAIANANVNENSVYTSVTPNLSGDMPIGNVTYTISGGADAVDFTINGTTGVVSMVVRDFESPVDANTDNVYEIEITATDDDNNSDTETWTVTVTDQIEVANFTIDAIANANVNENSVYTSVTPNLSGDMPIGNVTYTISGGADAADFTINGITGVVSMVVRDFESPVDANTDNVYEIEITATDDDNNSDMETWTVTVIDQIEVANFTIDAIANANVNENSVYTSVTPNLSGDTPIGNVTYTISGGADAADFTINGTTGVVSMVVRDFESPVDANTDNVYEIEITATDDDNNSDTETWTVTVIDDVIDNFSPPTGLSLSNQQINENEPAGTFIGILSAQDPDTGDSHTFSLLGTNASLFTIQDDSLKAAGPFNFEQQDVYTLTIQVEDAQGFTFSDQFEILVLNVNESPTEIILSNNTVNEEDIVIEVGILSTVDEDVADTHSYTILAGDHSSFFNIADDRLITDESLASDNGTQYTISVQSEDLGGLTITRDFVITVARKVQNEFNFPNAFTPNGDHENDTWEIPFLDLVDDCKVLIMDRDGNVVFESIGYDAPWDGTYGGNKLPKSTYFYIIRESRQGENQIHKGYVVIL